MKKHALIIFALVWVALAIVYMADPGRRETQSVLNTMGRQTAKDYMLSSLNVTAIEQDRRGLVWIGTSAGINVYDGMNYIQFFHDRNDTTALPDDYINVLHLDRRGKMWAGTQNGLACYEGGGLFRRIPLPSRGNVTGICDAAALPSIKQQADTAALVVCTPRRAYLISDGKQPRPLTLSADIRKATAKAPSLPHVPEYMLNKPADLVSSTFRDKYGNLWIGYHNAGYQILSTNRTAFSQANENILHTKRKGATSPNWNV